jgi:hypothetical protein
MPYTVEENKENKLQIITNNKETNTLARKPKQRTEVLERKQLLIKARAVFH